mmetsp:Transcript_14879/g.43694  ORF Transcript_14879/g.43694 Transcript_14879/m.43694 type:complete len:214 (-) Transcript_14879:2680-3321(-)
MQACADEHASSRASEHAHAGKHARTHASTHACPHACMPYACTPVRMHARTHACPYAYMPVCMHAHTHAYTHARTRACPCTSTQTCTGMPCRNARTHLGRLLCLWQLSKQVPDAAQSGFAPSNHLNDHLHRQERAVVQEPVVLDGAVAARLHHEVAIHALLVQLDALADDILVAALEAQVLAAQVSDKLGEAVAGHTVGHDGRARVVTQRDCRH